MAPGRPTTAVRRPTTALFAALATAALVLAGCSADPADDDADQEGTDEVQAAQSITVKPLFVQGAGGGVGEEVITREVSDDGGFRLDFSEDEVGGLGEASRAASWNAAIVSTLLTGQPLQGRFGFEVSGKIDGPSAGALKTVALIALQSGHSIDESVSMTGTINATGTIGPVGGIPEKLVGAADAGLTKVLVPLGQRNSLNSAGEEVDVVREGDRLGVEVVEVGDIYEAYVHLTGTELPAPAAGSEPRLDNRSYDKVDAQVDAAVSRYSAALNQYSGLPSETQASFSVTDLPMDAAELVQRGVKLQREGLVAGALLSAQQGAALMETLLAAGLALNPVYLRGIEGLPVAIQNMTDLGPAEQRFFSFLDQLSTFEAKTVTDAEALVQAYAGTFDAYSLLSFAQREIDAAVQKNEAGGFTSIDELFTQLAMPLLYSELAKTQLTNTQSTFEIGRDNGGAPIRDDVDLRQVGDFFRRGADANFAAFRTSGEVAQLAEANGLSVDVVVGYLAQYDMDIALSVNQASASEAFAQYIGDDKPNASYAVMGNGLSNYVRNQLLVEKYYNNAVVNNRYQVVGLRFEGALNNALDLGRSQLASEINRLREHDSTPVLAIGQYEAGGVTRSGEAVDRFQALGHYNGGFLVTRLLTHLGGFEDDGGSTPTESAEDDGGDGDAPSETPSSTPTDETHDTDDDATG